MTRTITIPLRCADIFQEPLKTILREGLEPFPGRAGWPFATGMRAFVDEGRAKIGSTITAWWISKRDGTICRGSMLHDVPPEVQKHCAHVALATVGSKSTRGVLEPLLSGILEHCEDAPDHEEFDILFFRNGLILHFPALPSDLAFHNSDTPGELTEGLCRSGIAAIFPQGGSHHEKMLFLGAANAYLSQNLTEDLERLGSSSFRSCFDDLQIIITP